MALAAVLHKDDDRFRLVGRLSTRLELACSRCLEPFEVPVDAAIDLRYLPQALAGNRDEDPDHDPSTTFYSDDRIDLGQMVREQCYLALPMKPLCRADCQGLCPMCGTNLNHRALQLPAPVGRSPAGGAAGARFSSDQRRCLIQNADTPRPAAASAARTTRCRATTAGACPQCGEPKAPHRVCAYCGFYNERQVRAVDEE